MATTASGWAQGVHAQGTWAHGITAVAATRGMGVGAMGAERAAEIAWRPNPLNLLRTSLLPREMVGLLGSTLATHIVEKMATGNEQ